MDFTTAGSASLPPYVVSKHTQLISLLQINQEEIDAAKVKMREIVREAARRVMPDTKVVDEKGNPLVVYHGTKYGDIHVFDHSHEAANSLASIGFWFSPVMGFGKKFADKDWRGSEEGRRTLSVFLNMTNPKVYETTPDDVIEEARKKVDELKQTAIDVFDKGKASLEGREKNGVPRDGSGRIEHTEIRLGKSREDKKTRKALATKREIYLRLP